MFPAVIIGGRDRPAVGTAGPGIAVVVYPVIIRRSGAVVITAGSGLASAVVRSIISAMSPKFASIHNHAPVLIGDDAGVNLEAALPAAFSELAGNRNRAAGGDYQTDQIILQIDDDLAGAVVDQEFVVR